MRFRRYLTCLFMLGSPLISSTIVSITGEQSGIESGSSAEWVAESWTQAGSYTDVSIKATLERAIIGNPFGNGFAFLEEKVGSHAVEVASLDFRFPLNSQQFTLFSNLTLGPGTYYLGLYGDGFWIIDQIPSITRAPDVSKVSDTLESKDNGFTFQDTNNQFFPDFIVTGTEQIVSQTPEPATSASVGALLLMTVVLSARRRQTSRCDKLRL